MRTVPNGPGDVLVLVGVIVVALFCWVAITALVVAAVMRWTRRPPPASYVDRARSWDEVPSWVRHDKEWGAAVVLLGAERISARTEEFVDFPARQIDWLGLRLAAAEWSPDDRLLVEVAYDLAYAPQPGADEPTGRGPVSVAELLRSLSDPDLDLVHSAMSLRRGR
ncbi:MAG: hypothetical protein H0U35_00875 [Sporichthyaceae bacterium]|nr:hypothetical protein [Sporichthyaceae bacterium]